MSDDDNDKDIADELEISVQTNREMLVPRKIGDFLLFKIRRETNMSVVFDLNDCDFVMKCIPMRYFNQNELDFMLDISHPNIMNAEQSFKIPGNNPRFVAILMRRAQGDLLDYIIQNKILTENIACKIISDILNALKWLHDNGIWHRDIKLENIFVMRETEDGPSVVIGDLGFAHRIGRGFFNKSTVGTIPYAAPELLQLDPNSEFGFSFRQIARYTNNIDIFSLGVVLYWLLFNNHPFGTRFQYNVNAHLNGAPPFPNQNGRVSDLAIDLIRQMLCPDPFSRPGVDDVLQHDWFKHYGSFHKSTLQSICVQYANNVLKTMEKDTFE